MSIDHLRFRVFFGVEKGIGEGSAKVEYSGNWRVLVEYFLYQTSQSNDPLATATVDERNDPKPPFRFPNSPIDRRRRGGTSAPSEIGGRGVCRMDFWNLSGSSMTNQDISCIGLTRNSPDGRVLARRGTM